MAHKMNRLIPDMKLRRHSKLQVTANLEFAEDLMTE
jgi:hypothetical protein